MPELPVSAVVLTRNEEANLPRCLRLLAGVGEIFVVDSRSEDATRAVARAHGAQLVDFEWNGRYPKNIQSLGRLESCTPTRIISLPAPMSMMVSAPIWLAW